MPLCNFKLEIFTPDKEDLKEYALAFKEAIPNWQNYLGEPIFRSQEGFEENAEDLLEEISDASPSKCIDLLNKYELIPEKLYRITELSTGISESLPLYTGIHQISLEGNGSILAKVFFGSEFHLLDASGRLLSVYHHDYIPYLGLGQLYLIDRNDLYDSQVKGREEDPTAMEIVGYAPEKIIRSITFLSQFGKEYKLDNQGKTEIEIKGTGDYLTINNLKNLGDYLFLQKSDGKDDHEDSWFSEFSESWVSKINYHVGLEWKNIPDFTIQYNTFPFLHERDQWVLKINNPDPEKIRDFFSKSCKDESFIQQQLTNDSCSFQFMPIEIRGDKSWVEAFCLKNPVNFLYVNDPLRNDRELAIRLIRCADEYNGSVYPYLPEFLRKDIEILQVMKEEDRLFYLPDSKDVGEPKFKDIREFVISNQTRINEILEIFPNILHFAPEELLNDRQLLLRALPLDNHLVAIISDSLRDDPEIIAAASGGYFASLEYASIRLREDPIFVLQMINKNGSNICFAADWIREDRKFILSALHAGSKILNNIPNYFRDDEEIMLEVVKSSPYSLKDASERLRLDKAFNLKALENGTYYRNNLHNSLLDDREIVLKAMQMHPHEFEYIPERFKSDREIVLTVVSKKGGYGKYIKNCSIELRDDSELIKAAIIDNGFNIRHASPRLLADRHFISEMINENPSVLANLPENMQKDPELRELASRKKEELNNSNPTKPSNNLSEDDLLF